MYPSLPQKSLIKTCKRMTGLKGGKDFFIDNILLRKKGEKLNYQMKTSQTVFHTACNYNDELSATGIVKSKRKG